jgi:mono/diheme cytochrome c family protein
VALAASAYTPPPLFRTDVNVQPEMICKTCHLGIAEQWERSAHSKADGTKDLLWGRMYLYSLKETRGKTFIACGPCHEPVSYIIQDFENLRAISSDGVDCSSCHMIAGPGSKGIPPYEMDLSKYSGTIRNPTPTPAHGSAYTKYISTSEYCGGCHDYSNQNDVKISTTLAEWKASKYAKLGVTCQSCHMPGEPGRNSYLGPSRPRVADHSFDHDALAAARPDAATLKLRAERAKSGDSLRVFAVVTNTGWGHSLPTGNDQNMAIVRIRVLTADGAIVWENDPFTEWSNSVFGIILQDEVGNWPVDTWMGAKVLQNRRIKAGASGTARYRVPVADHKGPYRIEAQLLFRRARPTTIQAYGLNEEVYGVERVLTEAALTAP